MKKLIPLLLLACGPPPDLVTSKGTEIYLNQSQDFLTKAQADNMETFLVEALRFDKSEVEGVFRGLEIHVRSDAFPCAAESQDYATDRLGKAGYLKSPPRPAPMDLHISTKRFTPFF